jgi:xylan 1,4-beta-xylosidase
MPIIAALFRLRARFVSTTLVAASATLLAALVVGACSRPEPPLFSYQNPNMQLPFRDTHIVPDRGQFYAVGTSEPFWEGANPGVKLYVSDDLVNWTFVTLLIDAAGLPDDVWYKDRFWAPELRRIGERYYLTFNCQNNSGSYAAANPRHFHAVGLAVADRIDGPYTVLTHDEPLTSFASNDGSLYEDDDEKVYLFFNNGWTDIHHIFVAELDVEKGALKEEPVRLISQEPGTWDGGGIEGAHVVKHESVYYLFYSSWTRGYAVGYATATDIRGPWTKYERNPLFGAFRDRDGQTFIYRDGEMIADPESPYQTVGHNQVFVGPDGRFWTSFHGYKIDVKTPGMLMDPFWFEDGVIRTDAPTYTPQTVTIAPHILAQFPGLHRQ